MRQTGSEKSHSGWKSLLEEPASAAFVILSEAKNLAPCDKGQTLR